MKSTKGRRNLRSWIWCCSSRWVGWKGENDNWWWCV